MKNKQQSCTNLKQPKTKLYLLPPKLPLMTSHPPSLWNQVVFSHSPLLWCLRPLGPSTCSSARFLCLLFIPGINLFHPNYHKTVSQTSLSTSQPIVYIVTKAVIFSKYITGDPRSTLRSLVGSFCVQVNIQVPRCIQGPSVLTHPAPASSPPHQHSVCSHSQVRKHHVFPQFFLLWFPLPRMTLFYQLPIQKVSSFRNPPFRAQVPWLSLHCGHTAMTWHFSLSKYSILVYLCVHLSVP